MDITEVKNKESEISKVLMDKQTLPHYTMREVSKHCSFESCWIVIHDKIYNVTDFLHKHPGGLEIMLEHAGYDATMAFEYKGHSSKANYLLEDYLIGVLVKSDRIENDDI